MSKRPEDKENGARVTALLRLADAHAAEVLAASRKEIAEDAAASGLDLRANASRMLELLDGAEARIGKAAMDAARAAMKSRTAMGPVRSGLLGVTARPANDGQRLTMAARNGTMQSDRDKSTVQDDLDEIDAILRGETEGL